jgi:hypothetical protein
MECVSHVSYPTDNLQAASVDAASLAVPRTLSQAAAQAASSELQAALRYVRAATDALQHALRTDSKPDSFQCTQFGRGEFRSCTTPGITQPAAPRVVTMEGSVICLYLRSVKEDSTTFGKIE